MFMRSLGVLMLSLGSVIGSETNEKILQGSMMSIEGEMIDLSEFEGKVVMIVNVASRCGFTRQYAELQELYEKYGDQGLVVLGFPCNQFGGQEPGSSEDILDFCQTRFGVTFPLFERIKVRGAGAAPLFKRLTAKDVPIEDTGAIRWNFEKFLIGRDGELVGRYRSRTSPSDEKVIAAIEAELAE